ncbi:MAG TPA: hypothetical protein VK106_02715 [Balneolaceae bacterium]|nr:hypothetical protein [Balneolaceae bacterium]
MPQHLTVSELHTPIWTYLAFGGLAAAVLFFGGYLLTTNALWAGILRLLAFVIFAGSIWGFLRLREGNKVLSVVFSSTHLIITYKVKGKDEKEELFKLNTIKKIQKEQISSLKGSILNVQAYKYQITFTDTDRELILFTYAGQPVLISAQDSRKVDAFLKQHHIQCEKISSI